jgi:hypothetical protein
LRLAWAMFARLTNIVLTVKSRKVAIAPGRCNDREMR